MKSRGWPAIVLGLISCALMVGCSTGGVAPSAGKAPAVTPAATTEPSTPPAPTGPTGTIAYVVDGKEVWTVSPDGTGAKKVATIDASILPINPERTWPQGGGDTYSFAFPSFGGPGPAHLGFVNVRTGATAFPTKAGFSMPVAKGWPLGAFNADGSRCYFVQMNYGIGNVCVWNTTSTKQVGPKFKDYELIGQMVLSPDGSKIAANTGQGLLVMGSDGKNARFEPNVKDIPVAFSGDNSLVYVQSEKVYSIQVAGDNSLSDKQPWDSGPTALLYVNGVGLGYGVSNPGAGGLTTWLPEGSGWTQVGSFPTVIAGIGVSPSPDGKYMAVQAKISGSMDIWVFGADGTKVQVTKGLGEETYPIWLK